MLKFMICSYIITLAVFGYILFEINLLRYAATSRKSLGAEVADGMKLQARKRGIRATAFFVVMLVINVVASLATIIWW